MEVKEFPQLNEKLYYEELPNGLQVYMLPKPGFNKSYATFTTKYGSIDNSGCLTTRPTSTTLFNI